MIFFNYKNVKYKKKEILEYKVVDLFFSFLSF